MGKLHTGIWMLCLILLGSCDSKPANQEMSSQHRGPFTDTFTADLTVDYAQNFSVTYSDSYKVAHVHFQSSERGLLFDQKIVMVQRGATPPDLKGDLANAWVVEVPVRTVAANDDGEITRLKTLGLTDQIIAMGGGGIYDDELRRRWEEKKIASIGYSFHRSPQPELLLTLDPGVVLLYAYDQSRLESVTKLRQLGVQAIPQFAWAEPSFLGKAEWIKFSAMFFNKEAEAEKIFEHVVGRCDSLMELVKNKATKKTSFLVYHPSDGSDWNAHRNDFYASFLEAAGSVNVLEDNGPTHAVGMNNEKLLDLAKDADVWLVNSTTDTNWPPASYLSSFKAYRNQQVYHYQKRTRHEHDAYDWYETPEVRPDLVLADLVSVFYPDILPDHRLVYFEKVNLTKQQTN